MNTLDPNALECLAVIVEEGGFERAALRLSITQSAVSQRLRALENQMGAVLLVRSRPVRLTAAGEVLMRHAQQWRVMRADLRLALQALAPSVDLIGPGSRVPVALQAASLATWAQPALDALAHRGVPLEVMADDGEFTGEWLRSGQVLGCVTGLDESVQGCQRVALGSLRYVAVAEAGLAAQRLPQGLSPHHFRDLPFVAAHRHDDLAARFVQQAFGLERVPLRQAVLPGPEAQLRAVRAGWGVGVVPWLLAEPWLAQGGLVDVAPGQAVRVPLYWHCWRLDSEVLASLTQALVRAARQALEDLPPDAANASGA